MSYPYSYNPNTMPQQQQQQQQSTPSSHGPTYAAVPPPRNANNANGNVSDPKSMPSEQAPSSYSPYTPKTNPHHLHGSPPVHGGGSAYHNTNANVNTNENAPTIANTTSSGTSQFLNRHSPEYHHQDLHEEKLTMVGNTDDRTPNKISQNYNSNPTAANSPYYPNSNPGAVNANYTTPPAPSSSSSSTVPQYNTMGGTPTTTSTMNDIQYRPYPQTQTQLNPQFNPQNPPPNPTMANLPMPVATPPNSYPQMGGYPQTNPNGMMNNGMSAGGYYGGSNNNIGGGGVGGMGQMKPPKKAFLKLVVIGSSAVGKTSLLNRYHSNKFSGQRKVTIGADFHSKELTLPSPNNSNITQKCTLSIWDTAGQERFRSLGTSFYRGADACMLVYDVTDDQTFQDLDTWRDDFLKQIGRSNATMKANTSSLPPGYPPNSYDGSASIGSAASPYGLQNFQQQQQQGEDVFPFILIGNKIDKISSDDTNELDRLRSRAEAWCESKSGIGGGKISYYEASAKTSENVETAFVQAATMALAEAERRKRSEPEMRYPPVQQTVNLNRGGGDEEFQNTNCC